MNNKKHKIAITGASGFVGKYLIKKLLDKDYYIIALVRKKTFENTYIKNFQEIILKDIADKGIILKATRGVDTIIHLAALTHSNTSNYSDYYDVNVKGTQVLAESAVKNDVSKIIMLSSIKANGENGIYNEQSETLPLDYYGKSKLESENALLKCLNNDFTDCVILRSPLVYGANVKGNLKKLMEYIFKGYPIPVPYEDNKRSMIGLDNLCEAIIKCVAAKNVSKNIFLVSDDIPVSTRILVNEISKSMNKKPKTFFLPFGLIRPMFKLIGKSSILDKIGGSLEVNNSLIKKSINWQPKRSFPKEINDMVDAFKKNKTI